MNTDEFLEKLEREIIFLLNHILFIEREQRGISSYSEVSNTRLERTIKYEAERFKMLLKYLLKAEKEKMKKEILNEITTRQYYLKGKGWVEAKPYNPLIFYGEHQSLKLIEKQGRNQEVEIYWHTDRKEYFYIDRFDPDISDLFDKKRCPLCGGTKHHPRPEFKEKGCGWVEHD